jgi:hypothetical protein
MIKTLYGFLSWVPILGSILKAAYIGSLVKQVTGLAQNWKPNPELAAASGDALDKMLTSEANTLVGEFTEPLELGMIGDIVVKQGVKASIPVMRKAVADGGGGAAVSSAVEEAPTEEPEADAGAEGDDSAGGDKASGEEA